MDASPGISIRTLYEPFGILSSLNVPSAPVFAIIESPGIYTSDPSSEPVSQRVSETSSPNDCRRPKPRPDFDGGKDPVRLVLTANNCANLVGLKLRNGNAGYFLIFESTTRVGCFFEPASDGISAVSLYSGDCGLIQPFDAESGNLIKGRGKVLESVVGPAHIQAEGLSANLATVSTMLSRLGSVESVADDVYSPAF